MSFAFGGGPTGMSGLYHFGAGGLGWLGSEVPADGEHFASLLYNDVTTNGWEANEVRWRLTGGTLPFLQIDEDGSIYHPAMPDGTYTAVGIVSVDGVDVGESTLTVTWGTVLGESRRTVRMSPLRRTVTSMARRTEPLEDMDVDEEDTVTFTFADELRTGETVSTATLSVEVYSGTDPTPTDLLDSTLQVVSPVARQRIVNPRTGVVYLLRCKARTSQNRNLTASGYLRGIRL